MLPFAITNNVLGIETNVVVTDSGIVFCENIPKDVKLIVGSKSYAEIARLYCFSNPYPHSKFPSEAYQKVYRNLFSNSLSQPIPWLSCIPHKAYKRMVKQLVEEIRKDVSECIGEDGLSYYLGPYAKGNMVYSYLKPALIDKQAYEKAITTTTTTDGQATVLRSFAPDKSGYTEEVIYDRSESVTGRMKVKQGPNILLLKQEHRNIITSRFGKDGEILYLDYKALEPRVFLGLTTYGTLPLEADLYQQYNHKLFDNLQLPREVVKEVILSDVYGAGKASLHKKLAGIKNLDSIVSALEDEFKIPQFRAVLAEEAAKHHGKWLITKYNRKVSITAAEPYMYPNRVVQSTAVDVAHLGFLNILQLAESLGMLKEYMVPLFVLHDGMVIDLHKNMFNSIPTLCKFGALGIDMFENIKFYLSAKRFYGNE